MAEYVNVLSLVTARTLKSPLNPVTPAPSKLVEDLIFLVKTLSPILKLCGCSETTVTILLTLS